MRARSFCAVSFMSVAAACAPNALAQHEGDIELTVENGRVTTNERVYEVHLGEVFPNFADEPGFDCEPGTFRVPGSMSFRIHGPLLEWNGSALIAPVDGERVEIAYSTLGPVLTPTDESIVDGFSVPIGANGQWHRHLEYTLAEPAGDGVYVMQLTLVQTPESTNPAGESEPFWLVFNQHSPEADVEAAIAWVEENVIGGPCTADFNAVNGVTVQDIFDYLTAWLAGDKSADFNNTNGVTVQDIFDFLTAWLAGC